MSLPRYANWCFTFNNYEDEDIENLKNVHFFKYCIFGKEVGEEGTPHLQGYFELERRTTIRELKKKLLTFNERFKFHFEPRYGTQKQAIEYCKKDEDWEEWGLKKKQGERKDLDQARRIAAEMGMREVSCKFNLQAIKVAEKFLSYNEPERNLESQPLVIYIHGPSGSGKSELTRKLCESFDTYHWSPSAHGRWWDGYDGHEMVVLNEMRLEYTREAFLLELLDKHAIKVEVKGGSRQMRADKFIINTILTPEQFWTSKETIVQLKRRISIEIKMLENFDYEIVRWAAPISAFEFLSKPAAEGQGGNTVPPDENWELEWD